MESASFGLLWPKASDGVPHRIVSGSFDLDTVVTNEGFSNKRAGRFISFLPVQQILISYSAIVLIPVWNCKSVGSPSLFIPSSQSKAHNLQLMEHTTTWQSLFIMTFSSDATVHVSVTWCERLQLPFAGPWGQTEPDESISADEAGKNENYRRSKKLPLLFTSDLYGGLLRVHVCM